MTDLVVARQAVFDRQFDVIGYELLFRTTATTTSAGAPGEHTRGDLMTAQVLFNSLEIGIDRLAGDRLLFCNAERGVLVGEVPIVLPPERVVIEVVESVVGDEEIVVGCQDLVGQGFRLALDNFRWFEGAERLLEMASIVKIDVLATPPEALPALIGRCREFEVTLLAEKVENQDWLSRCETLGFDYFQGYFLSRPQIVPGRNVDPSRLAGLRLAEHLWNPDTQISTIEQIIRTDPVLSHRVLKVASVGSAFGLGRNIDSLREALVIIGSRRLQGWVALLLLAGGSTAPEETFSTVLLRARLCELLAERVSPDLAASGFMTGMLSCLDLVLGMPTREILSELSVDAEIKRAVLDHEGPLGTVLAEATFLQLGGWLPPTSSGVDTSVLQVDYLDAVGWADEMVHSFIGAGRSS
jgi:EAL and modified HD-GYP domain-containing signal transduction protein